MPVCVSSVWWFQNLYLFTFSKLMLMEATLNNGQFRPGNETPFMYTAFASEGEMLGFYLSLNRFVNPVTYCVQGTDMERLDNLLHTLGKFQLFMGRFGTYQSLGIKPLIEGFGLYMMQHIIYTT